MIRALVADDQQVVREGFVALLGTQEDIEVVASAADGAEAVALSAELRPDVVLMDVRMPVLDGISAAEKIGKKLSTPIVLLTGTADPATVEKARLAGVMSYVVKPFRSEQVYAAVDLAIHQFVEVSTLRDEVASLKETLESRKMVEKAKGALMKKGLSEPEAYRKYLPSVNKALEDIRARGFCASLGELKREVYAVGVPMRRTVDGEIVAFNCAVPAFMMKKGQLEDDIGPRLVAMVRNIEASLGLH